MCTARFKAHFKTIQVDQSALLTLTHTQINKFVIKNTIVTIQIFFLMVISNQISIMWKLLPFALA